MVPESRQRARLELSSSAQSPPQRALHPDEYGESPGWRIQHQRDGLGTWAQERLGLLRIAGRRPGVELRFHTPALQAHRRLAWGAGPPTPGDWRAGIRTVRP